jgi:WD40 repeat protein
MGSGRELITLSAHNGAVRSVTWTPDGKMLLSTGDDGLIQVYAMDIDLLLSLARSRVTRNLSPEECQKYLHLDEVPPIP